MRGRRDKVVLATKFGLQWNSDFRSLLSRIADRLAGNSSFWISGRSMRPCLRPDAVRKEVQSSLKHLGTDYIDLVQTHWRAPDERTPIAETMGCLMELKLEGLIRAVGICNVTTGEMDEYRRSGPIDTCQPSYCMLDRAIEADVLPYCRQHGIGVLAYSPLALGLLTGTIGMDREVTGEEFRSSNPWFRPQNRRKVLDMVGGWRDLTEKYACTASQLVIAWTVSQPGVSVALCGARKPQHARENAPAADLILSADDVQRMRHDVEALGQPAG